MNDTDDRLKQAQARIDELEDAVRNLLAVAAASIQGPHGKQIIDEARALVEASKVEHRKKPNEADGRIEELERRENALEASRVPTPEPVEQLSTFDDAIATFDDAIAIVGDVNPKAFTSAKNFKEAVLNRLHTYRSDLLHANAVPTVKKGKP